MNREAKENSLTLVDQSIICKFKKLLNQQKIDTLGGVENFTLRGGGGGRKTTKNR